MGVTKEDLREANRELEAELEKQNQENEKLKEQVLESAIEEVKAGISAEREEMIGEMRSHLETIQEIEQQVWRAKSNAGEAATLLESATQKMGTTIRAGITLAAMNWWIIFPTALLAGVVGQAAGRVLIEGTSWTATQVLIGAGSLAVGIPLLVGLVRAMK